MKYFIALIMLLSASLAFATGAHQPHYPDLASGVPQYASFPIPTEKYPQIVGGLWEVLKSRAQVDPFNVAATVIFLVAILHTFCASFFMKIAHYFEHKHDLALKQRGKKAGAHSDEVSFLGTIFHFLGEIEAVFGLWVIVLAAAATYFHSWHDVEMYLSVDRSYTEPLFVVVIMAIAASRPVLVFAETIISKIAQLGKGTPAAWWLSVLVIAPIFGSFITEPAAMTIGALLLAKRFYRYHPSSKLAYATLGLLFVNVSIGGTLTHFAAPPVLMVASSWEWTTPFMFCHFGLKSVVAILLSSLVYFLFFRKELSALKGKHVAIEDKHEDENVTSIPVWVTAAHLGFLAWTVYTAHFPVLFIGGFLFFLAFIIATRHHQIEVSLRGPVLVGFFLAALVIHGGCQSWWIGPVIQNLSDQLLMLGATILTGFNDNAAITYLAAQVSGISETAKYAVVAGAVTGGGLTVIANAPNPAGQSILSRFFRDGVSPLWVFAAALLPTIIAYLCFVWIPSVHVDEHQPAKAAAVIQSTPAH